MSVADLSTITISDFRSIRGTVAVPLEAPVVLLHGTNGAGKSTVMSALELALTGSVTGVSAEYQEHLVHRGAEEASIKVTTVAGSSVEIALDAEQTLGKPLLDFDESRFFRERCYLQQQTLGRLLDLYESSEEGDDSALTTFVKDLLGLDELDALIDGLHAVTHKARVKRLVPDYADLDREVGDLSDQVEALQRELDDVRVATSETKAALKEQLAALEAPPALENDLDSASGWLERGEEEEERALVALVGARRELLALEKRVEDLFSADDGERRTTSKELARLESAASAEGAAAEAWRTSDGAALEALLDDLRTLLPGIPAMTGASDPAAILAASLGQVDIELQRLTEGIATDETARADAERLDHAVATARQRLESIDQQLAAQETATAAEELGKALAALLPHVHTEDCPICGRDYSEIASEPLSAHLAARVSQLGAHAERLQELAKARLAALSDLRAAEEAGREAARRRLEPDARVAAQAMVARLEAARLGLASLEPGVSEGAALLRSETEANRNLAVARNKNWASREMRTAVEAVAESVGEPPPKPTMSLDHALASVAERVSGRMAAYEERAARRAAAVEAVEQLEGVRQRERQLKRDIADQRVAIDHKKKAIAEIEHRRSVMRELRTETEAARTRIVRRVFTQSLNRVWRDLFVRLAPEEPFVPSFRVPAAHEGIVVVLETTHRDGQPGGPPGAMLSAGNLNTAALTLFLALNLSVDQRLPWILLDDPVQSMDEVHVSQFAALLRTLAKEHGRRVVIAVHERALFDYLALELSPATPQDGLITVELSRNGSTQVQADFQGYVEDRAFETV